MKVELGKQTRKSKSLFTSVTPTQQFEICPESFEFTQGAATRNIKIKTHLCLRHVLPKSNLNQAILQLNKSTQRQLGMKLDNLRSSQQTTAGGFDQNQRNFMLVQDKKQRKWKKEDEIRLSNMNLPMLGERADRPKSMKVVYRMPEYSISSDQSDKDSGVSDISDTPRLPRMQVKLRREQTEIVTHRDRTFMTKLPEVKEIEPETLERHNTFCGSSLMGGGAPTRDERFKSLQKLLNPTFLKVWDLYPAENIIAKSRQSKYALKTTNLEPPVKLSNKVKTEENGNEEIVPAKNPDPPEPPRKPSDANEVKGNDEKPTDDTETSDT